MSDNESACVENIENDLEIILNDDEINDTEEQVEEISETIDENQEIINETKPAKQKRSVKNPQPKLNEQTLKGPRGLVALESYFDRVKFKGQGHEEEDLKVLLKTYEYWCHRLFPKFPFDNCIARVEKLGTKKATQQPTTPELIELLEKARQAYELNHGNCEGRKLKIPSCEK